MFKVSFKNDFKTVQTFNNRATVVTLRGTTVTPEWFDQLPRSIENWVTLHPSLDIDRTWDRQGNIIMIISVTGRSVCAEEDTYNPVIGERIAESKAKIRLYGFMLTLCSKICCYWHDNMFGNADIGKLIENPGKPPKDCLYLTIQKYRKLFKREQEHLKKLLEEV